MSIYAPETGQLAPEMTAASAGTPAEKLRAKWRVRIMQAKEARFPYERTMLSDLAFASGQHWLVYDEKQRRLRHIGEVDTRYQERELYTADRITEYRESVLSELESDNDRPDLLVAQEGVTAEAVAEQLNQAVAYAWEHEWGAQEILTIADQYTVDMGVAAIRCRWDPDQGAQVGHAPVDQAGTPITDPGALGHLASYGQLPDGSLPGFKPVREGRTCWEAYSALHLLPPPGVTHERYFPWWSLARPVPISQVEAMYPQLKGKLTEDGDIANLSGVSTGQQGRTGVPGSNRLRDHVWVYTCFEEPCAAYPDGLVATFVSNQYMLADQRGYDYKLPDGCLHSGCVFLHWRRRSDRFWSASFITNLKDPQRIINRRKTQNLEIIDRGMPKTYGEKGSLPEIPKGPPMEWVELNPTANPPIIDKGTGPGAWMYEDIAGLIDDMGHASTVSAIRMGENPEGVETYSQLALLNDNETAKRARTFRDRRRQIGTLVELGVYDMRTYWPASKQILVAGTESQIERVEFQKTQIPDFYQASVAPGAPAPRSQGAQLKQLDAIWAAAVQAWVAVNNGDAWVGWYSDSVKAGKPLDLPSAKSDTQKDLAYLENGIMREGGVPPVMDYDNITVHLPVHREEEDQARAAGDMETVQRITVHIQQHIAQSQANAAQLQATAAGAAPTASPGAPGSAVPFGAANGPGAVQYMQPRAREPYPQTIPGDFAALARGQ